MPVLQATAEPIVGPELNTFSIGRETKEYRWAQGDPFAEGSYDETHQNYSLTGNGHGVYWCQDGCAFAHVAGLELKGDFTFTARMKTLDAPETGIVQAGIMVKSRLLAQEPVLSLRWDGYWAKSTGSGLTWFNRIAEVKDHLIMDVSPSEKSCHGLGQGCLGRGLENHLEGYTNENDLWLRVKRVKDNGKSKYFLYAKNSAESEWNEIESVAGTNDACNDPALTFVPNMQLPHFQIPDDRDGSVEVGLFVANGDFGAKNVTATFDNITLEIDDPRQESVLPNTFDPQAVWWPMYSGPHGNFTTTDDNDLIQDLRDARLVWSSEYTPPGKSQSTRYGCNCGKEASGGGAGLVAADGKVFSYFYEPIPGHGTEEYDPSCDCHTAEEWDLLFSSIAHDAVLCLDAETGERLWKDTLGTGKYYNYSKGTLSNHAPCYYNGYLYVAGISGSLYCLNAHDGTREWTSSIGALPWTSAPVAADGVIVTGSGGGRNNKTSVDLVAFDAESGDRLWTFADYIGGGATPTIWKYEDKEYIIAANAEGIARCIEPRTGNELWKITDAGLNPWTVRADGNYLVLNTKKQLEFKGSGQIGCWYITPDKAEKKWELPESYGYPPQPIIYKGYLYGGTTNETHIAVSLEDGTIRHETSVATTLTGSKMAATRSGNGFTLATNNRMIHEQMSGHYPLVYSQFSLYPDSFSLLDSAAWTPPVNNTSTYSENFVGMANPYVDGRLFFRGGRAIHCFDLRKQAESSIIGRRHGKRPGVIIGSGEENRSARIGVLYDIRGRMLPSTEIQTARKAPTGVYIAVDGVGSRNLRKKITVK